MLRRTRSTAPPTRATGRSAAHDVVTLRAPDGQRARHASPATALPGRLDDATPVMDAAIAGLEARCAKHAASREPETNLRALLTTNHNSSGGQQP